MCNWERYWHIYQQRENQLNLCELRRIAFVNKTITYRSLLALSFQKFPGRRRQIDGRDWANHTAPATAGYQGRRRDATCRNRNNVKLGTSVHRRAVGETRQIRRQLLNTYAIHPSITALLHRRVSVAWPRATNGEAQKTKTRPSPTTSTRHVLL